MRLYLPLFAGAAMLLCGCPNPNTYTVPRTLDPGKVQVNIAPEVIGFNVNAPAGVNSMGQTVTQNDSLVLPMVPTAGVRIGLASMLDVGVRLANFDSLGADLKVQLVRGGFDLALDPGLQAFGYSVNNESVGLFWFHLPVLLGFNVSEAVTLVLAPGATVAVATASVNNNSSGASGVNSATGFLARFGLGADFRIARNFALHPEVTFMKGFNDANALIWVGGLGFNIGAQPNYSDMSGNPPPPPAGQ